MEQEVGRLTDDQSMADRYRTGRSHYERCVRNGRLHLALLELVHLHTIARGAKMQPADLDRLICPERRDEFPAEGFLGCFTRNEPYIVLPLKRGLNRVGRDPQWSDYTEFPWPGRLLEPRQWLLIVQPETALVVDDHSTNGSVYLPGDVADIPGLDSSFPLHGIPDSVPGRIDLDWNGNTVQVLREGDILVSNYAGFVFGRYSRVRSGTQT